MVSVLVPALNCAADVEGFVECIRGQSYPADRFELIVADNGSTDDTVTRLAAHAIVTVDCAEKGRSRALNAALRRASGQIVCTTDMSCRPVKDWISRVVQCFDDPDVGCVAGEIRQLRTHSNLALRFQSRNNYMSPLHSVQRNALPFLPFADGANASFRRAVFDQIGPFDETFFKGADVEICYRMFVTTGYKIVFCRDALVWEAGEPTMGALLKQRFRIGMGSSLLVAKYPSFFEQEAPGSWLKRGYWKLVSTYRGLKPAAARVDAGFRDRLEDAVVRGLMMFAQAVGRQYGRWYLERRDIRPPRIDPLKLRQFVADIGSMRDRVTVR